MPNVMMTFLPFLPKIGIHIQKKEQQLMLLKYRITYLAETTVNWCPELGTVLSNDEVKDGYSERGGYPVVRKNMMQWSMRPSAPFSA